MRSSARRAELGLETYPKKTLKEARKAPRKTSKAVSTPARNDRQPKTSSGRRFAKWPRIGSLLAPNPRAKTQREKARSSTQDHHQDALDLRRPFVPHLPDRDSLWTPDAIERQLAHCEQDSVLAVYNYAQYLPERRKMMLWCQRTLMNFASGSQPKRNQRF